MMLAPPVLAALAFVAGFGLGLVHFASLGRVSALFLAGGSPVRALALQFARLALLAGFLVLAARLGAAPLLAAALGVLIARAVVLRRFRKEG